MENTPRSVMKVLESLSREKSPTKRREMVESGLTEIIKWFTLAAQLILEKKVNVPKQTLNFMERHKETLNQIADQQVDMATKRQLILKPGGGGFLGGAIIRSLLRWDGTKSVRNFRQPARAKKTAKKRPAKRQPRKKKDRFVTIRRKRQPTSGTPKVSPLVIRRVANTPSPLHIARFSPLTSSTPHSLLSTPRSRSMSTSRSSRSSASSSHRSRSLSKSLNGSSIRSTSLPTLPSLPSSWSGSSTFSPIQSFSHTFSEKAPDYLYK